MLIRYDNPPECKLWSTKYFLCPFDGGLNCFFVIKATPMVSFCFSLVNYEKVICKIAVLSLQCNKVSG